MLSHGRIHIGTSGWHYEHWKGPFYPDDIAAGRFLEYYAGRFPTVEINNSFYRMPERTTLIQWRDSTPRFFLFAVKASRYITHMKKLKDSRKALSAFLARVGVLEDKLGPILFQLPPRWKVNAGAAPGISPAAAEGPEICLRVPGPELVHAGGL